MKKVSLLVKTAPLRVAAFAAIPAVGITVLAALVRSTGATELDRLMGESVLVFGGIGALIGFIAGRASAK